MTQKNEATAKKPLAETHFKFPTTTSFRDYIQPLIIAYPTTYFIDSKGIIRTIKGSIPIDLEKLMSISSIKPEDIKKNMDTAILYQIIETIK